MPWADRAYFQLKQNGDTLMDSKMLTHIFIGTLAFFLLGFLIYELALGSYLADHVSGRRETPIWWSLVVSQAGLAGLAAIAIKWRGAASFVQGARVAASLGLFYALAYSLDLYATSEVIDGTGAFVTVIAETFRFFLVGGLLGWFAGRKKKIWASRHAPSPSFNLIPNRSPSRRERIG
jgi:hypothetical protein